MPTPTVTPLQAPQAPVVQPNAPASAANDQAASEPVANAEQAAAGIPDEVLQIPAMSALLQGAPAAFSMPLAGAEKRPEVAAIMGAKDAIFAAGLNTYRSLSGDVGVLFNQMFLPAEELMAADKAGELLKVAPPFDQVNEAVAKAPLDAHPAMMAPKHAPAAAQAGPPTPPAFSAGKMSAGGQEKLLAARLKNMQPGPPSSGTKPGAGRLLNQILKPVV